LKKSEPIIENLGNTDILKEFVFPLAIGFLIPGGGHLFIKDKKRGMLIFILLFITFFSAVLMNGKIYTPSLNDGTSWDKMVSILASAAEIGNGLYYFGSIIFVDVAGDLPSIYYEVGSVYGITAGLLNFLVLFSLFDLIRRKKGMLPESLDTSDNKEIEAAK